MTDGLLIRRIALLFVAIALVTACGSKAKEGALPSGSRVVALGDSLTAGFGVAPGEAWPELLANKTGWVIINGGASGDTSSGALHRLPALLEEHNPVLVLVGVGATTCCAASPRKRPSPIWGRYLQR